MKRFAQARLVKTGARFLSASAAFLLASCSEPAADNAFTIRNVSSTGQGRDTSVKIKLTTSGELAEADAASIVQFVQIVAKREATKRQTQVARERGRAAQARLTARPSSKLSTTPGRAWKPVKPRVRYLAVETEKSAPSPGQKAEADTSVMIWDTQAQAIVGNDVYDIKNPPPAGTIVRFETYAAQYVGAGF